MTIKKFADIKQGEFFRETGRGPIKNRRVFIKLQNRLPSGINIEYSSYGVEAQDTQWEEYAGKSVGSGFNAVDIRGYPGCCPAWVEFQVIPNPFKGVSQ